MVHTHERWEAPPPAIGLDAAEVHLWCAGDSPPDRQLQELASILSADERRRAGRFAKDHLKRRYIAGRGLLRTVLCRYLERGPETIRITYGSAGKPCLADAQPGDALFFNLSHSGNVILFGVTRGGEIGIDIEYIKKSIRAEKLARRFFSLHEHAYISSLPARHQHEAFYRAWTRKEAFLKATGRGIAGIEDIEVTLAPDAPPSIISINGSPPPPEQWTMRDIRIPAPGYAGALVCESQAPRLSGFILEPWA